MFERMNGAERDEDKKGEIEKIEKGGKDEPKDPSRRKFLGMLGKAAAGAAAYKMSEGLASAVERDPVELRKKWAECKKVLGNPDLRDDIAYIESWLGESAKSLLFEVKSDLQLYDQLVRDEEKGEDVTVTQADLVRAELEQLEFFWDAKEWERRWEKDANLEKGMDIKGFEAAGYTNENVKRLVQEWFGNEWANGAASRMEYHDEEKKARTFGIAGLANSGDLTGSFYRHGSESVDVYETPQIRDVNELKRVVSHEIAHHWDWGSNRRLPLQERVNMLAGLLRRFGDPKHFHSVYVEVDVPKEFKETLTTEQVFLQQAKEFWATLNERYDTDREGLREHQPRDYGFVKYWRDRLSRPIEKKTR